MIVSDPHGQSALCKTCAAIAFSSYFQPPLPDEIEVKDAVETALYKEAGLGSLGHIRRKATTCSFCDIIREATHGIEDDANVRMWSILYGQNRSPIVDDPPCYCIRIETVSNTRNKADHVQLMISKGVCVDRPAHFLARMPKETFDMEQARKWLDVCLQDHGASCNVLGGESDFEAASPEPEDLLAIDLHDMCICRMPSGSEYLALSYCWPAEACLTLTRSNQEVLFKAQALTGMQVLLPGTVRDAIACAKEFRYRYLWIDALCIVQDDTNHKTRQLRQMDRVYSCALLTLVSAYQVPQGTKDSCSGFPGFHSSTQRRRRIVKAVQDLQMMLVAPAIDEYLQTSRWHTRCWTFQEHELSRRLLYFTSCQVYFTCSCSTFCEDTVCESVGKTAYIAPWNTLYSRRATHIEEVGVGTWGEWTLSRKPIEALSLMWLQYEIALSYYTHRDISYPSDILNAFEGVKAVLAVAMQTDFWQGLPEKILPQALVFQLKGEAKRRRNRPLGQPPSEPLFPSWTWAGWESRVNLNTHLSPRASRTDAEWYIINDEGLATRLDVLPNWISKQSQRPSQAVISAFLPNLVPRQDVDASSKPWRNAKTLACWTTRAHFVLDGTHHSLRGSNAAHEQLWPISTNFAIKDSYGDTAGCILLPKDYFEAYGVQRMTCEFIAVSRTLVMPVLGKQYVYFDEQVYKVKDWCHMNVMMITRPSHLGDYEALRAGIGVVHQDAWVAARPETDFVKLV